MTSNLAFQVRFLVGLPFYWFVVKWPNTTGFDPVIRRFESCRAYHLALYPLLEDATITAVCLRYSSDGYSPERPCEEQRGAAELITAGTFLFLTLTPNASHLSSLDDAHYR